jgi:hypothetical protein
MEQWTKKKRRETDTGNVTGRAGPGRAEVWSGPSRRGRGCGRRRGRRSPGRRGPSGRTPAAAAAAAATAAATAERGCEPERYKGIERRRQITDGRHSGSASTHKYRRTHAHARAHAHVPTLPITPAQLPSGGTLRRWPPGVVSTVDLVPVSVPYLPFGPACRLRRRHHHRHSSARVSMRGCERARIPITRGAGRAYALAP